MITVLTFPDPDVAASLTKLTDEIVYATGRYADFEKVASPNTIVLAISAVAPARGGPLPNGTRFRRADKEFWSKVSVEYSAYVEGNAKARVEVLVGR